ncbi:MAG TPA: DUF2461 domain-containing protein [Ignavibacteria bacterium]|nr:DUF2461 domain-containing protein [Ignavibacteria bacterium]
MLNELIKPPFLGFEPDALKFLKSLSFPKNNNKAWFDIHREEYESFLKKPMRDLIDNLAVEINKIDPDIVVNYKSIFRINRDIRFSKIKTPYKTHYAAAFAFGRIKSAEIPQFYFHFSSKEFIFATGQYSTETDNLKKIRNKIYTDFKNFKSIINKSDFKKIYKNILGESLAKLPKGYENISTGNEDPLLFKTLMMKQFYVEKIYDPTIVLSEKVIDILLENINRTYDFTKYLSEAIK